jgi:hypothetical protein
MPPAEHLSLIAAARAQSLRARESSKIIGIRGFATMYGLIALS